MPGRVPAFGLQGSILTQSIHRMIETLLISILILAVAMALLCVKVIFRKNGHFSSQHVHDNPALRKQGIHCVIDQDREARRRGGAC